MIVFVHIPRTAGSSIHSYFYEHFGPRWIVVSGTGELPMAADAVIRASRDVYIGGHVGLHDLSAAGIPTESSDIVFSVVREPVERIVSFYFLVQRSPEWFVPLYGDIHGRSFEYFYDLCRDKGQFSNDVCRLLANSEDYDYSVSVVKQTFHLLGCISRIDEFGIGLSKLVAPRVPGFQIHCTRLNAALHAPGADGSWNKKVAIRDVANASFIDRVKRENESDVRMSDFVERQHGGLFRRN